MLTLFVAPRIISPLLACGEGVGGGVLSLQAKRDRTPTSSGAYFKLQPRFHAQNSN
ncbi:MAG: hypothetical protein ACHBN1_25710 [Heteroscytonema crispum UTEX LB 1556]